MDRRIEDALQDMQSEIGAEVEQAVDNVFWKQERYLDDAIHEVIEEVRDQAYQQGYDEGYVAGLEES